MAKIFKEKFLLSCWETPGKLNSSMPLNCIPLRIKVLIVVYTTRSGNVSF